MQQRVRRAGWRTSACGAGGRSSLEDGSPVLVSVRVLVRGQGWNSCWFSRNGGTDRRCSWESHAVFSEQPKTESARFPLPPQPHPPTSSSNGILQSAAIPATRRSLASVFLPKNNRADVIFKVGFKGRNARRW